MADLEIKNLHVSAGDKEILRGVDLHVRSGEFHALMGPNGSGKSTLANVIMGHPGLEVTEGEILFDGENITEADPDERARLGLFMAFQYPVAIPGVTVAKYLRTVMNAHREEPISLKDFRKTVEAAMELTQVPKAFSSRYLNDGFSGGEKKRMEILQLALQKPKLAVLDETDSGLDIDALNVVGSRRQRRRRAVRHGRADHHALPAHPSHGQARVRAHHVPGQDRQGGRPGARHPARERGLRLDRGRGRRGERGLVSLTLPAASDFPTLAREGLVYLDSAATSQTPAAVIEAMDDYYRHYRGSIHRGVYPLAVEATEAYEGARARAAAFVGSTPGETVFTRNATEALNLVASSWGGENVGEGDLIVLTEMEHHSNIVPWQMLAERVGARIEWAPIDDDGTLDLAALDGLLAQEPKVVAVTHVSNVLGTINPIDEIARRVHAAGAIVVVDGSQAVPHIPVDVAGIDFYAWTAHKAYGPTGIGILHGSRDLLETMPPFLGGGHMISRVTRTGSTYAEPPTRFEAGTMPIAEAVGLGAAVDFLAGVGMEAVAEHDRDLAGYALGRLGEIEGVTVHGPADRVALHSFVVEGIHPHDVAEILGRQGVCVRAGHHCAQILMQRLGAPATSRASFALHSTRDDADRLVDGLAEVRRIFA